MTTSTNSETELLTEHFGYPPVSLIDDIINSVNVLAERALNSVEQGLLNAPPAALGFKPPRSQRQDAITAAAAAAAAAADATRTPAERAKDEVESGTHQLETLLCASIDRNFDKFELYVLRNIFTIRPPELCNWIRLSHYDGLDFSAARSSSSANRDRPSSSSTASAVAAARADAPTIESVTALRRRLRESMRLNALLTAERARNEALLEDLRRLVGDPASAAPRVKTESVSPSHRSPAPRDGPSASGNHDDDADADREKGKKSPFAFLHQKGDLASSGGGAASPLATTAAFTLSQMQALRALSAALGTLTPDLKKKKTVAGDEGAAMAGTGAGSGAAWRRERVEYVETATRRHLETVHGLELGRHGEVRDGEWQGPGRSLARGEVEGLEGLAAALGGNGDNPGAPVGGGGASSSSSSSSSAALAKLRKQQQEQHEYGEDEGDRMDES